MRDDTKPVSLGRERDERGSNALVPLLSVRKLRKNYRSGGGLLEVLRGVDFDLDQSGFVAIVGQSGSGKSTLLHLMGLLDEPDSGEVYLSGTRIDNLPAHHRDRLRNTDPHNTDTKIPCKPGNTEASHDCR